MNKLWRCVPVRCIADGPPGRTTNLLLVGASSTATLRPYRWDPSPPASQGQTSSQILGNPVDLSQFPLVCPVCQCRGLYRCGQCGQASCGAAMRAEDGPRPGTFGVCGWCGDRESVSKSIKTLPSFPLKKG